jgi:hypothetical protein
VTFPRIEVDGNLVTIRVTAPCVDLERVLVGSCCLLTSLFFIIMILVGRN